MIYFCNLDRDFEKEMHMHLDSTKSLLNKGLLKQLKPEHQKLSFGIL